MKELLENADEFLIAGVENFAKSRYNVAASDFFKSIVIFCDYLIYYQIKRLPKNHNDRFNLLNIYFKDIYETVSNLFKVYVDSYNLKMKKGDVIKLQHYANELKRIVNNQKKV